MQFTVPQFVERESKIFGPFTFTQFIYVMGGGIVCFILYFIIPEKNLLIFLFATAVIMSLSLILGFVHVSGRSLPTLLKNFFFFTATPKIYLWKRKNITPRMIKINNNPKKPEDTKSSTLKLTGESRLKNLANNIETKK